MSPVFSVFWEERTIPRENCNCVKDDNVLVKEGLQTLPEGTVLVVDGGASTNCALLGDNWQLLRKKASRNYCEWVCS